MNKKLRKKDKILLGILVALIVVVIGIGAFLIVRNTNAVNEQTAKITSGASKDKKTSSSKASSKSAEKSSGKTSSGKKNSDTKSTESSSVSSSKASSENKANSSSETSSKSGKSSKTSPKSNVKGDKVKRVKPKENTSHTSSKTLNINGKTCYVGDTITIVMNITSQKSIVNYQGEMSFDSKYLKIKDVKSNDFGVANDSGNKVLYNASAINGMNFSETGTVFTATFEVLQSGSTTVNNNLEIISELVNNSIRQLSQTEYDASVDIYS